MMLYLLQEGPAQTLNYMLMGYTVIFSVIGLYLVSLVVRQRNLKKELEMLQELEAK